MLSLLRLGINLPLVVALSLATLFECRTLFNCSHSVLKNQRVCEFWVFESEEILLLPYQLDLMSRTIPPYKSAARFVAWTGLVAIIAFMVVPASFRPVTELGSNFEHFSIFFAAFAAFKVGYEVSTIGLVLFALVYCGGIELIQIPLRTRHARINDFIVDFVASSLAIAITLIGKRVFSVTSKKGRRGGEI